MGKAAGGGFQGQSLRGGGATGVQWGDASPDGRFESKLLAPGAFADPEHSAALAESVEVPEVAPQGEGAGLVDVQGSRGEAAWRRRLSPRHRRAVQEFFSNGKDQ